MTKKEIFQKIAESDTSKLQWIGGGALAGGVLAGIPSFIMNSSNMTGTSKEKRKKAVRNFLLGTAAGTAAGAGLGYVGGRYLPQRFANKHFDTEKEYSLYESDRNLYQDKLKTRPDIKFDSSSADSSLEERIKAMNVDKEKFKPFLKFKNFKKPGGKDKMRNIDLLEDSVRDANKLKTIFGRKMYFGTKEENQANIKIDKDKINFLKQIRNEIEAKKAPVRSFIRHTQGIMD